jgi:hypothetical protein
MNIARPAQKRHVSPERINDPSLDCFPFAVFRLAQEDRTSPRLVWTAAGLLFLVCADRIAADTAQLLAAFTQPRLE